MTATTQAKKPKDFTISRVFNAPRERVWDAWTKPELMARWWGPEVFTTPTCTIDLRIGGALHYCMRSPEGKEYWGKSVFKEIVKPERFVSVAHFSDSKGGKIPAATYGMADFPDEYTMTVSFEEVEGGRKTRVTVQQTLPDEAARNYGAVEGWGGSFLKLDRILAGSMERARHATFTIERQLKARPERVFAAWADVKQKEKWFAGPADQCTTVVRTQDFRIGGRDQLKGKWQSGMVSTFDAIYHDIIPNERIIYSYEMHIDGKKISVSLATIELFATDTGTRMIVTEQGAFFNGHEDNGSRERGTNDLMDKFVASIDK